MRTLLLSITLALTACAASPHASPVNNSSSNSAAVATAAPKADLSERRAQMILWLGEYKAKGQYPVDDRGMPLSVFKDAQGTLCPMAFLMHKSGRDDLVNSAVAMNNKLRLADVHDGPIEEWIEESGLTHAEVELVQGAMTVDEERRMMQFAELQQLADAHGQVTGQLSALLRVLARGAAVVSGHG